MLPARSDDIPRPSRFSGPPVIAKQILPWFGGAASVWATCLVFFQSVLLPVTPIPI
jgi:hypothetical protein